MRALEDPWPRSLGLARGGAAAAAPSPPRDGSGTQPPGAHLSSPSTPLKADYPYPPGGSCSQPPGTPLPGDPSPRPGGGRRHSTAGDGRYATPVLAQGVTQRIAELGPAHRGIAASLQ
jgi:hypothetical protein